MLINRIYCIYYFRECMISPVSEGPNDTKMFRTMYGPSKWTYYIHQAFN